MVVPLIIFASECFWIFPNFFVVFSIHPQNGIQSQMRQRSVILGSPLPSLFLSVSLPVSQYTGLDQSEPARGLQGVRH